MTQREKMFQEAKSVYVPGTHFRIKMRQTDSREHNGKRYRHFTVLQIFDDIFLCEGPGHFRESFTAWDMLHKAELEKIAAEK